MNFWIRLSASFLSSWRKKSVTNVSLCVFFHTHFGESEKTNSKKTREMESFSKKHFSLNDKNFVLFHVQPVKCRMGTFKIDLKENYMENGANGNFIPPDCTVWHFHEQPRTINGLCYGVRALVRWGRNVKRPTLRYSIHHFNHINLRSISVTVFLSSNVRFARRPINCLLLACAMYALLSISGVRVWYTFQWPKWKNDGVCISTL